MAAKFMMWIFSGVLASVIAGSVGSVVYDHLSAVNKQLGAAFGQK